MKLGRKFFTDAEIFALPERSAIANHVVPRTDPNTGFTHMERRAGRYVVNDSDVFSFMDVLGNAWRIGKDQDGYFKSRV